MLTGYYELKFKYQLRYKIKLEFVPNIKGNLTLLLATIHYFNFEIHSLSVSCK